MGFKKASLKVYFSVIKTCGFLIDCFLFNILICGRNTDGLSSKALSLKVKLTQIFLYVYYIQCDLHDTY